MRLEISIHHLTNQNQHEWLTCADINNQQEIVCGTDQGVIYHTQSSSSSRKNNCKYNQLIGHSKLISDICYYDSNGTYALSCSADNDIRLWHSQSSRCITIYRSHLSPVWCLAAHSTSDRFASGSMDQTVRLWTPERLDILRTFIYHSDDINTLSFHPKGKYLASGSNDGLTILWSIEQAQPARIFKSSLPVEHLTFTSDGNHLVSINHNSEQKSDRITLWDIRSANEMCLIHNIPSHRRLLKAYPVQDTTTFVTGFQKTLLFFDINNQKEKLTSFSSEISHNSSQRLIHVSSNESNKAIMSTLRQRRKPITPVDIVRDLDAFVKVENDFKQPTTTGGTISIITIIVVICLSVVHIATFQSHTLKYDYDVDWDHDSKLKINIDMTVAMNCKVIGSDVLDVTNTNPMESGKLDEEDTWFELSPQQQVVFDNLQMGYKLIREQYHAIHDLLWLQGHMIEELPEREVKLDRPHDACRLHGTLEVNKLAGNFHIILGKAFSFFGAHAHISPMGAQHMALNFSHRIDHLSFGLPTPGLVQPLNGDLKLTNTSSQIFQYFLEVVPTVVQTSYANVETYQYAVTEKTRTIDHASGSHGIPGIFIRYEISPLKIAVKEVHRSYFMLLVELAGIFGGVYATSGMIHSLISVIYDAIFKQCKTNTPLLTDMNTRTSIVNDNTPTIAIGITPDSSSVM
ncbi:unnamed protein product [Adineta ricciae]|uniref:Uncharacterized protein n=1 Tax=Adineta ricciae TaxID=249248 RepID=A0A814XPH3_ADIRI|nr:unnamed protein product [Adineta ricciae]